MTRRIIIDSEGRAYLDGALGDGIAIEADMRWTDNLPSRVTPCPERREYPVARLGVRHD